MFLTVNRAKSTSQVTSDTWDGEGVREWKVWTPSLPHPFCFILVHMEIPASLNQAIRPTTQDARYVAMTPPKGYVVNPLLSYRESLEFSTKRQCDDLIALIKDQAPEADLTITDVGEQRVYAPFCRLVYFNAGGLDDPRIYMIQGTVVTPQGPLTTIIDVGWFINVRRLIEAPATTRIQMVVESGGVFPHWAV